jgi:2-haloacid dehalogenase
MIADIRHFVFDIGRVLIHYDPSIPFNHVIPDEAERTWFLTNVCTSAWNVEQDRGRCWQEAEALLIAEHPERAEQIRAFRKYWHEMISHSYGDSVAIMERLIAEGRDVTILTNFASDTYREAEMMYPFLLKPRGVTVSGDIGLIKPDIAIFETHARNFDLEPKATIFIDDSIHNVEGAKAAGWNALHFTGADRLRADLATLGIGV